VVYIGVAFDACNLCPQHEMRKNNEQVIKVKPTVVIKGASVFQGLLDRRAQQAVLADIRKIVAAAPLFSPITPTGKLMSVQMTSAGHFGWVSDRTGNRYSQTHPNGAPWPVIPASVLKVWHDVAGSAVVPECCLVNLYREAAKMGMHQDRDEADFTHPVVSVSLGDDGLFRIGNQARGGPTESIWLRSGDVIVLGGAARLAYHGIDKTRPGSSTLLTGGGRINLTLRVVT